MDGISRREAARRAGINESTVRRAIDSGALDGAVLLDGSLDAARALKLLSEHVQRGRNVPAALTSAKTRRLRAQVAKLQDEVEASRATAIAVESIAEFLDEQRAIVAKHFAALPWDAGAVAAGMPAAEAHRALRDLIAKALERIVSDDADNPEPESEVEIDLDTLSPNDLTARRISLQAEALEIETALNRGELRLVPEVVAEFEERLGACKSLLTTIPNRLAQAAEASTPDELERQVEFEIQQALTET